MIRGPERSSTMEGMQDEGTEVREGTDPEGVGREGTDRATGNDEEFGGHRDTRFGADVRYQGRRDGHEYVAEVRHRFLDTSAVVWIDGVRHDPKAEKTLATAERAHEVTTSDGLALKLEEGFFRHTITVRRPTAKGRMKDREKILVRTTTLGGAGEVDVVRADEAVGAPLVPSEGSSSAAREARRAEHPVRFGLIAAGAQAARFLLPLLGIGALLSGLLDPVLAWIDPRVEPILTWLDESTRGIRTWAEQATRPLRDLVDAVLEPLGRFLGWLWDVLFGWVPQIRLGIDLPDWVFDYGFRILGVVAAFLITSGAIRDRRKRLETARRAEGRAEDPARTGDGDEPDGPGDDEGDEGN